MVERVSRQLKRNEDELYDDEIDLIYILIRLWSDKWWIFGACALFAALAILYSLSLPNVYRSEGVYVAARGTGAGGMSDFGGLAAIAGFQLGGESNDVEQAVALAKSWPFLEKVILENGLAPYILAVKGWDKNAKNIIWDSEKYNFSESTWVDEELKKRFENGQTYLAYITFRQWLNVNVDPKTNMIHVSVQYYDPSLAKQWVDLVVQALNSYFKRRDIGDAQARIKYLQGKIKETNIAEMQSVFYEMIEGQMKDLMLAEVDKEYLLVEVVEPKIPEIKDSPRRSLIVFFAIIFGGLLSAGVVLYRAFVFQGVRTS